MLRKKTPLQDGEDRASQHAGVLADGDQARPKGSTARISIICTGMPAGNVFINEHLSAFKKNKSLSKNKKLALSCARDGKIFSKKTPEDKAVRVRDAQHFNNV